MLSTRSDAVLGKCLCVGAPVELEEIEKIRDGVRCVGYPNSLNSNRRPLLELPELILVKNRPNSYTRESLIVCSNSLRNVFG